MKNLLETLMVQDIKNFGGLRIDSKLNQLTNLNITERDARKGRKIMNSKILQRTIINSAPISVTL